MPRQSMLTSTRQQQYHWDTNLSAAFDLPTVCMHLAHGSCRGAAEGYRDVELLASLRSMVDSLTEELRLVGPAAKRQRTNSNRALASTTAGDSRQAVLQMLAGHVHIALYVPCNWVGWMQLPAQCAAGRHTSCLLHQVPATCTPAKDMQKKPKPCACRACNSPAPKPCTCVLAGPLHPDPSTCGACRKLCTQMHVLTVLAGPPHPPPHMPAPRAAARSMLGRAGCYAKPTPPAPKQPKIDKQMKTAELLALLGPGAADGSYEARRLQALQVLAVRSGVMQKEQQVRQMHTIVCKHVWNATQRLQQPASKL